MKSPTQGFTLIELSIVLVIIGFIVGGVLVGRDMISASVARAQITQIEKYHQAVNTFKGKYNALPGDMGPTTAAAFGFSLGNTATNYARGFVGQGDENGLIEGVHPMGLGGTAYGYAVGAGEPAVFWSDLSYANGNKINLIEGSFNAMGGGIFACAAFPCGNAPTVTSLDIMGKIFPEAKTGNGNFVYAYSNNGQNYYGISVITQITYYQLASNVGLSVRQAYNMDAKIDDGVPRTGNVLAQYIDNNAFPWAGTASGSVAVTASSSTCYDNAGNIANKITYSINYNNGTGTNCAISFKFQ